MPTVEQARAWYPENDPVHGFDHVLRVLAIADSLAADLGADQEIVRAAALLHDAAGARPGPACGAGPRGGAGRSPTPGGRASRPSPNLPSPFARGARRNPASPTARTMSISSS